MFQESIVLYFSTGICTSYHHVYSMNLVDFILLECLGMSRNACLLENPK